MSPLGAKANAAPGFEKHKSPRGNRDVEPVKPRQRRVDRGIVSGHALLNLSQELQGSAQPPPLGGTILRSGRRSGGSRKRESSLPRGKKVEVTTHNKSDTMWMESGILTVSPKLLDDSIKFKRGKAIVMDIVQDDSESTTGQHHSEDSSLSKRESLNLFKPLSKISPDKSHKPTSEPLITRRSEETKLGSFMVKEIFHLNFIPMAFLHEGKRDILQVLPKKAHLARPKFAVMMAQRPGVPRDPSELPPRASNEGTETLSDLPLDPCIPPSL